MEIFNNLTLNTKDLTYTGLNDFYISESKSFGMSTGGGTTSESGKQTLAPSGSTTVNLKNTGEEREQITKATIGNGSIRTGVTGYEKDENGKVVGVIGGVIQSGDSPLLAGLNRNVNTSQEITRDMITGALDGSVTVDNRVFTKGGIESIGSDLKNFIPNAKTAVAGAASTVDRAFEAIYEYVPGFDEGLLSLRQITGVVSAPFSLLGETGSYLIDKDGNKLSQEDITREGSNYALMGQSSGKGGADRETDKDINLIVRVNPTDGGIGDTIKSAGMKVLNLFGLSDIVAMNNIVANDLAQRANVGYSTNTFHSQGTIIGIEAMKMLNNQGIILNSTQTIRAAGPAVYKNSWENNVGSVIQRTQYVAAENGGLGTKGTILYDNVQYDWNPKDGVRQTAAPSNAIEPFVGIWNLLFNINQHSMDNYRK